MDRPKLATVLYTARVIRVSGFGTSLDRVRLPDGRRHTEAIGELIGERYGEPCEVLLKSGWPNAELPARAEELIEEFQPDLVLLAVNPFPYLYESVPRRLQRKFGRAGKPLAKAGLKAADTPKLSHNRVFHIGRKLAHLIIGGDPPCTPEQVVERLSGVFRSVARREGTGMFVYISDGSALAEHSGAPKRRTRARQEAVHGPLMALLDQLHFPYFAIPPDPAEYAHLKAEAGNQSGDGVHLTPQGMSRLVEQEAARIGKILEDMGRVQPLETQASASPAG